MRSERERGDRTHERAPLGWASGRRSRIGVFSSDRGYSRNWKSPAHEEFLNGGAFSHGEDAGAIEPEVLESGIRAREVVRALPSLGKLVVGLIGDRRVPLRKKLFLGLTGAYLLLPFDLLPDFLPGLGQADDLVLVLFALERLVVDTPDYVLLEHWDRDPALLLRIVAALRARPKGFRKAMSSTVRQSQNME